MTTCLVPVFFLGGLCTRAFHQENTHCQTHFRVSDSGNTAVPCIKLLALDTRKSFAYELEQCANGGVLLQHGTHLAMAH